MTADVARLIAKPVNPWNARIIERQAQAELCFAHASGDLLDFEAMRGKVQQCLAFRHRRVDVGEPGFRLADLLEAMGVSE